MDPNWTAQYNFAQPPEGNGFTRVLYGSPVVNLVTSGSPANRNITVNSDAGSAVFLISSVPNLALSNGATIEVITSCTGSGNAGFELTFQNNHFGVQVYQNKITVLVNDGQPAHEFATASNASDVKIRATVEPGGLLRVYRGTTLIDERQMVASDQPLPRVLFWAEDGGTQVFKAMRFFIGGPVVP